VRDEWFKSLQTARSLKQLAILWREAGAARAWIPELEDGTEKIVADDPPSWARNPVLLTALLCPKPSDILLRLKASNAEIARAAALERGPGGPAGVDEKAVRRWLADVGPAADDLSRLWTLRMGKEPPWTGPVAEVRRRGDPLNRSDLAITGADLQALGAGGPRVGQILGELLDRVLAEPSLNTRESLLALARKLA
jgi:hypothetical protein